MVHNHKVKIYYEDTDAAGVVYYANYLKYMERARTELLFERGVDVAEYHKKGYLFAVADIDVHYKKPAVLGDIIDVTTEVKNVTHVTVTLIHRIFRDSQLLVEADIRLACINSYGKPQRLPEEFSLMLSAKWNSD